MKRLLQLLFLSVLFSLSLAQCNGNLRNDTARVSLTWRVTAINSVMFTFTAPSNESQYIGVVFSERNTGFNSTTAVGMIVRYILY